MKRSNALGSSFFIHFSVIRLIRWPMKSSLLASWRTVFTKPSPCNLIPFQRLKWTLSIIRWAFSDMLVFRWGGPSSKRGVHDSIGKQTRTSTSNSNGDTLKFTSWCWIVNYKKIYFNITNQKLELLKLNAKLLVFFKQTGNSIIAWSHNIHACWLANKLAWANKRIFWKCKIIKTFS